MKLAYLLTADWVGIYEQGKQVIVGTFDTINSPVFPCSFRPFGVAARILADDRRSWGKEHDITLRVLAETGDQLLEVPIKVVFPKGTGEGVPSVLVSLNLPALTFPAPGVYLVELVVDKKVVGQERIRLRRQLADEGSRDGGGAGLTKARGRNARKVKAKREGT